MNAITSGFAICIEAILYLLLYYLHDCTFNYRFYLHISRERSSHPEVFYREPVLENFILGRVPLVKKFQTLGLQL